MRRPPDDAGVHITSSWGNAAVPDALAKCVGRAGIMERDELADAWRVWASQLTGQGGTPNASAPLALVLTGIPGSRPTGALRWGWDIRATATFAAWCERALGERFGVTWQVEPFDDDGTQGPRYLRLSSDGQEECCDWRYLNAHRWMGAFCTIASRLLAPRGVALVELETGWMDVVVCACWRDAEEEIRQWFPEAE